AAVRVVDRDRPAYPVAGKKVLASTRGFLGISVLRRWRGSECRRQVRAARNWPVACDSHLIGTGRWPVAFWLWVIAPPDLEQLNREEMTTELVGRPEG